ncbi:nibrin [Dermacentor variabilis]|uniref:nibrin n=1 Tax=Dermacentor variabilis TaxID=34621 RepID=UPI003F5C56A5
MWSLHHVETNNVCYRLLCGGEFTVGRKGADILIANDASISREHAVLSVAPLPEDRLEDVSFVPLLRVKDLGSKYGTSVNSRELGKSDETALREGDIVTFGKLGSKYKMCYNAPYVVATSCLSTPEKERLKVTLKKIGARLKPEWSICCTHVVMAAIRLTMKATAALLAAKPVVTPDFFTEVQNRVQRQDLTDVDPAAFIPDVTEECLTLSKETFGCNEARKSVFSGKTFYFLTEKQYKSLGELVVSGGGRAELVRNPSRPTPDLIAEGSCVIKPSDGNETPVCRYLLKNKLRSLSASDVGMAVIYCSTDKFCNPRNRMVNVLWGDDMLSTQAQSQEEVCAPDTEPSQQGVVPRRYELSGAPSTSRIIPESRLWSTSASGIGSNLDLLLDANTGTTTVSEQARGLLTPLKESPIKNRLAGEPSSPKRSPRKIRKKDAQGTLPLECYFGRQSQKRKDDTLEETGAAKVPRLDPASNVDYKEAEVKREVLTPPSPEQQELSVSLADEEQSMEADVAESFPSTSHWDPVSSQEPLSQSGNRKQPSTKSCDALLEPSVNDSHNVEDLMVETSKVVVEFADLVLRSSRSVVPTQESLSTLGVRNFKRFRKAHQAHLVGLPKIIGGPDLEVYVPVMPGQEFEDVEAESDDLGHLFDYRPDNSKRRRLV